MSYGKDERHIDKYVWQLPIPMFDSEDVEHRRLAVLGREAEQAIAALDIDEGAHFPALRRKIRKWLADSSLGKEIESLVAELLGD